MRRLVLLTVIAVLAGSAVPAAAQSPSSRPSTPRSPAIDPQAGAAPEVPTTPSSPPATGEVMGPTVAAPPITPPSAPGLRAAATAPSDNGVAHPFWLIAGETVVVLVGIAAVLYVRRRVPGAPA